MKTTHALGGVVGLLAAGVMLSAVAPTGWPWENDGHKRKVTFTATVGDGKSWAGGFDMTVAVGSRARTYTVTALEHSDIRPNTFKITKDVLPGTSVSAAVAASWPGKRVAVQIRGLGVDSRPAIGTSPAIVTKTVTVK